MNPEDAGSIVESLYEEWYSPLVSYALRARTKSESMAEDAVQEAFLALYSELMRGGSVHSPKGWIYCVLRRQIVKSRRSELRYRNVCSALSDIAGNAPADAPAYQHLEIEGFLSLLTSREAEILQMRAKPMRYSEIATSLNISVNTVKTLLARAVRKMQEAARRCSADSFEVPRAGALPRA